MKLDIFRSITKYIYIYIYLGDEIKFYKGMM